MNRLSSDAELVGRALTANLSDGLRALAQTTIGAGMMLYVSPKLTVLTLAVVPPVVIIAFLYGRVVKKYARATQDALARASQVRH